MRHVICCWCDRDADSFENNVPVLFAGNRNRSLGFTDGIDLIFLSGYEFLADEYKNQLRDVGYTVHDLTSIYHELELEYFPLRRFGNYETRCFLRWLALSLYFNGEIIVHYDGDVVFNEDPATIGRLVEGRTFLLQGCPALTAVSDWTWFSQYREQLTKFVKDIEGYSAKAWMERVGWEFSRQAKWAGSRTRKIISSDQDLLSHLIHTDKIVQDRPSWILTDVRKYSVFENPLYLDVYENSLRRATYERSNGIDYIDGRRVLMWHMQSDFVWYLSKFIFINQFFPKALVNRISNDVENKDWYTYLHTLSCRYLKKKHLHRLDIYRYFFEDHDFHGVLNNRIWWKSGVFA
jgi:hypothetical protein